MKYLNKLFSLFRNKSEQNAIIMCSSHSIPMDILNLVTDKTQLIRVGFSNVYGDEESCNLEDYKTIARSTGKKENIIRIMLYDKMGELKYIVRVKSFAIKQDDTTIKVSKHIIDEILLRL